MNDEVPFEVVDYDVGDLSGQTGQDVIDPASNVMFLVHPKTSVKVSKDKCLVKLSLGGQIGPLGIDGNGKYKGKVVWHELIAGFTDSGKSTEKYQSDWWQKNARFGYRCFLKALGYDDKNPPRLNDSFLAEIAGKEFTANITKPEIRMKNDEGKYVGTGDFKNELANFKKVN